MKLIIQIPAYNEEATIGTAIADLPKEIPGIDRIEILVMDDGSSDRTSEAARAAGAHHVVRWPRNLGLAQTFRRGLDESLRLGADIIVHTDADNQYDARDVRTLIEPILAGKADMVVGCRDMDAIPHFSGSKRLLQKLGSSVVRIFSGTEIPDATSGFRAYSKKVAARLNVVSNYTYTLETLIQAGREGLALAHVPIRTNPKSRESRLIKSQYQYILRAIGTIFRIFVLYEPLKAFSAVAAILFAPAALIGTRFLIYYFVDGGRGHIQSLILAAILTIAAFQVFILGVVADLLAANRRFLSDLLERARHPENRS